MNKSFVIALALIIALIKQSSAGITQAQQDLILKSHNDIRSKTANGQTSGFGSAAKMYPLVWDNTLASIAQGSADKCVFDHDPQDTATRYCQAIGGSNCANAANEWQYEQDPNNPNGQIAHHKYALGQNIAASSGSTGGSPQISGINWGINPGSNGQPQGITWGTSGTDGGMTWSNGGWSNGFGSPQISALIRRRLLQADQDTSSIQIGLNGWIDEDRRDNIYSLDHFTQMVSDKTRKVGCGYKDCGSQRILFCDYYPAGNMISKPAYTTGTTGSQCPNGVSNGLCQGTPQQSGSGGGSSGGSIFALI